MTPGLAQGNSEDEALRSSMHGLDTNSVSVIVLSLWCFLERVCLFV